MKPSIVVMIDSNHPLGTISRGLVPPLVKARINIFDRDVYHATAVFINMNFCPLVRDAISIAQHLHGFLWGTNGSGPMKHNIIALMEPRVEKGVWKRASIVPSKPTSLFL